jgi:succinate dehydrogenase flavin-adding protein (antitoxin of CptAB toxin-antitoxin module)
MYEHLRNTPVYQNALRAPSAMHIQPCDYNSRIPRDQWPNYQVRDAGIRLDHLIRRALDPQFPSIGEKEVSAIITFLECFDRDFPHWRLSDVVMNLIQPRIALCRQIIEQRRQECVQMGKEPPSSTLFRETILKVAGNPMRGGLPSGREIEEVVYGNPAYHWVFFTVTPWPTYVYTLESFWR